MLINIYDFEVYQCHCVVCIVKEFLYVFMVLSIMHIILTNKHLTVSKINNLSFEIKTEKIWLKYKKFQVQVSRFLPKASSLHEMKIQFDFLNYFTNIILVNFFFFFCKNIT